MVNDHYGRSPDCQRPHAGCSGTNRCRPRVFAVYDVTGDWDSMVLARVKDRADLDDLTKTVFTLDGVARSYTHVVLNTVKEDGRTRPAPQPDDASGE